MDPHSFSRLDPDPEEKIFRKKTKTCKKIGSICNLILKISKFEPSTLKKAAGSGSALKRAAGSESAKNECGSTALNDTFIKEQIKTIGQQYQFNYTWYWDINFNC